MIRLLHSLDEACSVSVFDGELNKLIIIRTTEKRTETIIKELQAIGVGTRFGVIDILMCSTLPKLTRLRRKREYRMDDRQSLALIHEQVDGDNHLTFNFIVFVLAAGMIASVGLATNVRFEE